MIHDRLCPAAGPFSMSSPVGEGIFIKKNRENYKFAEKCFQSVHITYDYRIIFAENQLRPADNKSR